MDSFRPVLSCEKRDDMLDWKMGIVRIISLCAMANGAYEFVKEPSKLDDLFEGMKEARDDVFNYGQDKFLGRAGNSTAL